MSAIPDTPEARAQLLLQMYYESQRWLTLPWVQEKLRSRWEAVKTRSGEPFTLL